MKKKKRVTGVGGIFFKSQDPSTLKEWYKRHLGFDTDKYGAMFSFITDAESKSKGYLQWSVMDMDTKHMAPSSREFMINYRVEDLEWLVGELKKEGITILDDIETYDYGKFVHIMDPDGNKIELWEPVDKVFDDYQKGS